MSITLIEHLTHVGKSHVKQGNNGEKTDTGNNKCQDCDFVTSTKRDLKSHIQMSHKTLKVDLKDKIELPCDKCDFKCYLNIQLKKTQECGTKGSGAIKV